MEHQLTGIDKARHIEIQVYSSQTSFEPAASSPFPQGVHAGDAQYLPGPGLKPAGPAGPLAANADDDDIESANAKDRNLIVAPARITTGMAGDISKQNPVDYQNFLRKMTWGARIGRLRRCLGANFASSSTPKKGRAKGIAIDPQHGGLLLSPPGEPRPLGELLDPSVLSEDGSGSKDTRPPSQDESKSAVGREPDKRTTGPETEIGPDMEIASGGLVRQAVARDKSPDKWHHEPVAVLKIRIVDEAQFQLETGESPPKPTTVQKGAASPRGELLDKEIDRTFQSIAGNHATNGVPEAAYLKRDKRPSREDSDRVSLSPTVNSHVDAQRTLSPSFGSMNGARGTPSNRASSSHSEAMSEPGSTGGLGLPTFRPRSASILRTETRQAETRVDGPEPTGGYAEKNSERRSLWTRIRKWLCCG